MQETGFALKKLIRADEEIRKLSAQPKALQRRIRHYYQMHVMDNVRQRIEAGHMDFVNEIRVCTILFLGFPTLKVVPKPASNAPDVSIM